jgi:hypothetical protein
MGSIVPPAPAPDPKVRRAILGLYAVCTGLGAPMVEHPDIRWFLGNVTPKAKRRFEDSYVAENKGIL